MIPVFETALAEHRRVRLLERHLDRLARAGASADDVQRAASLFEEMATLAVEPTTVRIDVDGTGVRATPRRPLPPVPVRLATVVGFDPGDVAREQKRADRRWAAAAEAAAGRLAADEPLLVDRAGRVGETSRCNVFALLADGTVATPPAHGILPGVTRGFVIERTGAAERPIAIDDLTRARAVFLTSAGRGIVAVASLDGSALASDPFVDDLARAWHEL